MSRDLKKKKKEIKEIIEKLKKNPATNVLPESNHGETFDKPTLRNIPQNNWSGLLKVAILLKTMNDWGIVPEKRRQRDVGGKSNT